MYDHILVLLDLCRPKCLANMWSYTLFSRNTIFPPILGTWVCGLVVKYVTAFATATSRICSLHLFTVEPLLRGHPDERPPPLERPLDNVNLNVLISTPDERPPLLKGHFSDAKGVASQEGFHCMFKYSQFKYKPSLLDRSSEGIGKLMDTQRRKVNKS